MNNINNLCTKYCSGCKEVKSIKKHFNKHKNTFDGLQNYCKACKARATRNWKHGIDSGWLEENKIKQGNRCAICTVTSERLEIDHCHKTQKIRALLCHKCNSLLGMCDDSQLVLLNAISYLKVHGEG
jgi:Recombination endonuclease VII